MGTASKPYGHSHHVCNRTSMNWVPWRCIAMRLRGSRLSIPAFGSRVTTALSFRFRLGPPEQALCVARMSAAIDLRGGRGGTVIWHLPAAA